MFMADKESEELPDVCEIVIGSIGKFFRPPVDQIGLVPLNDYLDKSGWRKRIVESRFAPWTKEGVIFGLPHDVHPCTITFREDLYREAGIDLSQAKTWPEFHRACEKFRDYWRGRGLKYRHAVELIEGSAELVVVMLLQRGINPVDDFGNIYLEDPRVAQTIAFYATMCAGPRKVSGQTTPGAAYTKDLVDGNLCAFITPDWQVTYIKDFGKSLSGKMRMMPMPIFDPTDKPTSTHGGTCMAMTRACKNPDLAFKLMEYLYFSDDGLKATQEMSAIIPPVPEWWKRPEYHEPDPYFGGQKSKEMFTELALQIPKRYVTPMTNMAGLAMNDVVASAIRHVNEHGEEGLEEHCQRELKKVADELRLRMRHVKFEE
jgi:arabinosaccharide transport system substrate-binding protein